MALQLVGDSSSKDLQEDGEKAYQQASIYRELYETFNFPPFQCLLKKLKDPTISEATQMFVNAYSLIDEHQHSLSPVEKLGLLKHIIENPKTRQELVQLSKTHFAISSLAQQGQI